MAGRALGRILQRPALWGEPEPPPGYDRPPLRAALGVRPGRCRPDPAAAVLAAAGFHLPDQAVASAQRARPSTLPRASASPWP